MKKLMFIAVLTGLGIQVSAQQKDSSGSKLGGFLKKANSVLNAGKSTTGSLTTDEIIAGLKEALSQGTSKTTSQLSVANGFFKDAAIKILLPENVRKVEQKMRLLGMGKLVDQAVESMNHAAEDASRSAAPIFLSSIKQMKVQDALDILKGTDTAAMHYLKKTTSNDLTAAFRPVIETSLKKVNATKYWADVFAVYNKVAPTPVNTDINGYVTERALNGIFFYIGEEEKKIRQNPAERVSDILKKVFGSKQG